MANREIAPVLQFPCSEQFAEKKVQGVQFDTQFTKDVISFYDQMGTSPEFLAILSKHIGDTSLAVNAHGDESYLTIRQEQTCEADTENNNESIGESKGTDIAKPTTHWQRLLVLSLRQRNHYAIALDSSFAELSIVPGARGFDTVTVTDMRGAPLDDLKTIRRRLVRDLALDWIFYELTADMLANSVYMQQRFDHYIPDFNGQSPHYHTELTVAREFLQNYASDEGSKNRNESVMREYRNLRAGVALSMLADSMLRKEVTGSMTEALWVTKNIAGQYPLPQKSATVVEPLSKDGIFTRLSSLEPRQEVAKLYTGLVDAFDFDDEDI